MQIKRPNDWETFKERIKAFGSDSDLPVASVDLSNAMAQSPELRRAFSDATDPEGVDAIYFNDNMQLMLWYGPDRQGISRLQVYRNRPRASGQEAQISDLVIEWARDVPGSAIRQAWKLRWAKAQLIRGNRKAALARKLEQEVLGILSSLGGSV
jgi:hypothetical protein